MEIFGKISKKDKKEKKRNIKSIIKKYKQLIPASFLIFHLFSYSKDVHKPFIIDVTTYNNNLYQNTDSVYFVYGLERIIKSKNFGEEEKKFLVNILKLDDEEKNYAIKMFDILLYKRDYKKGMIKDISFMLDKALKEELKEEDKKDKKFYRSIYEDVSDMLLNRNFSFSWLTHENIKTLVKVKLLIENVERKEYLVYTSQSLGRFLFWMKDITYLERLYYSLNFKMSNFLYLLNAYIEKMRSNKDNMCSVKEHENVEKSLSFLEKHDKPLYFLIDYAYAFSLFDEHYIKFFNSAFNIDHFLRYNKEILQHLLETFSEPLENKPLAVVILQKEDYNGVLYKFAKVLSKLINNYKLLIYEVSNEDEFYKRLNEVYEDFGKINILIIGGHGNEEHIAFSFKAKEKEKLDKSDKKEIEPLKNIFHENSLIILFSCSTGKGENSIGELLSKTLNVKVFAPSKDVRSMDFMLDENGKVVGVIYDGEQIRY